LKSMNWIDLAVLIREISTALRDSIIDNIYLDKVNDVMILRLRELSGDKKYLVMKPGSFIYLTDQYVRRESLSKEKSSLKRNIMNCRLKNITQMPCERIIDLEISCGASNYILTIEIIPRGVVVLRDHNNKILYISRSLKTKDRILRVGGIYQYPPRPQGSLCDQDINSRINSLRKGYDLIRGLVIGLGVPSYIAEDFIKRYNVDVSKDPKKISSEELRDLILKLQEFVDQIIMSPTPCIVYDKENRPIEYYVYKPLDKECVSMPRFDETLSKYFNWYLISGSSHDKGLDEEKRILEKLSIEYRLAEEQLKKLKQFKEFIESNYLDLEETFNCYRRHLGDKIIECVSRFKDLEMIPQNKKVVVKSGDLIYEMDLSKEFRDNYIEIAKEISQLEKRLERIELEQTKIKERIRELEERIKLEQEVNRIKSERKFQWFERFHWIITSENLLAIGGKDADQNEAIVKKYMEDKDLFFHADIQGGSVFVLKNGLYAGERSIKEVAHLAACYSKAWKGGLGSIDVFYVESSQVSKKPPSGEYLSKGSFMIYGEKHWVRSVELKLGLGIEIVDNRYPRVVVGPPDYVANKTKIYSIIVPGDHSAREIAEELIKRWLSKHQEYSIMIKAIDLEEIISRIPGKSRIIYVN